MMGELSFFKGFRLYYEKQKGISLSEFEIKVTEVLGGLQEALIQIISCFGDPVAVRPVDLKNLLEIDMNLAWKISHIAHSSDLFSLGKFLPGKKAVQNVLVQSEKAGVPGKDVKALEDSFLLLEWLIRTYAGSRKELEVMLAGFSTEERTSNDCLHRRKSFEGNSYTFGVQSDVQLSTVILIASDKNPGTVDICRIKGQVGLYRTRSQVPWRFSGTSILDEEGMVKNTTHTQFPFPQGDHGPPILMDFSSKDLPEFGSVTDFDGRKSFYITSDEIGIKSAINLFTAETVVNTGHLYRKKLDEGVCLQNSSRTPTRKYVVELFLPEEFSSCSWQVEMMSLIFSASNRSVMTPGDKLPLYEQPVVYKRGRSPVPLPGVPVYSDLIKSCFQRLERDIKTYSLLRLTMEFPPMPARLDFVIALPEKPQ